MQNSVNAALRNNSIDTLAQKLDTTVPTLQMIIDGLKQPRDYDIRAGNDNGNYLHLKQIYVSICDPCPTYWNMLKLNSSQLVFK